MTSQQTIDRNRAYLNGCIRHAREEAERARASLRAAQLNRDEFELRQRPTYPTTEIRLALEAALEDVRNGHDPGTSQGRRFGSGVTAHGSWRYIWVDARAPHGEASNGRLWNFTEGEVDEMIAHIQQFGGRVLKHWKTEMGHAFQVEVAK